MILGYTKGFSWKQCKVDAKAIKIRRAITMVQGDNPNPDIAVLHPEWIREAQLKKYTELTKSVGDACDKFQQRAIARRDKFAGK